MMKRLFLITSALMLAVLLAFSFRHKGWTADGFVINNADATNDLAMAPDQTLIGLINQVAPRFVIEYANANKFYNLTDVPLALRSLIGQVAPRFVLQYANANKFYNLTDVPLALRNLIGQVAPRFVLQDANANKFYSFGYPGALVGDTLAPVVSNVIVNMIAPGSVKITWVTDEYTTSMIELGSSSGIYTQTSIDNFSNKNHEAIFNGLVDGVTYYYLIHNTDRSGNAGVTSELSFRYVEARKIFLPFLRTGNLRP